MKTANRLSRAAFNALILVSLSLVSWSAQRAAAATPTASMSVLNRNYQIPEARLARILGSPKTPAPATVDHQPFMPPVCDTRDFDADNVSASMGYYYRTFQLYMNHRAVWPTMTAPNLVDPDDLYSNSGGLNFYFAGEALTRIGGRRQSTPERYRAMGYDAFFANRVVFDNRGRIARPFRNNIALLKTWLAGTGTKPGDCLCLGIPVGEAWDECTSTTGVYPDEVKDPDDPSKNLDAGPDKETFKSYRALCVVGYDDARSAFKAVNCQGVSWGNSGYIWLSYDFVAKYAVEAWFLVDNPGFLAGDSDPNNHWKPSTGAVQTWDNGEYVIAYRGKGQIQVTTQGVFISGGESGNTLSVRKSPKAPQFLNPIPLIEIQTVQDFSRIDTNGVVVDSLRITTAGVSAINCVNGWIGAVDARMLKDVRMSAGVNSTWCKLNPDDKNISAKTVMDLAMAATYLRATTETKSLTVNLVGVGLRGINLTPPQAEVSVSITSKLGLRRALVPPFASYAKLSGEIIAGAIRRINVNGGRITGALIVAKEKGIASIQSRMLSFASAVVFPQGWTGSVVDLDADMEATIISNEGIGLIQATSGDISVGVAAGGRIGRVWSERRDGQGGTLSGMLVSGLAGAGSLAASGGAAGPLNNLDIGEIYGEDNVDVELAAGANIYQSANHLFIKPNCQGAILKIGAKKPYTGDPSNYGNVGSPSIQGKAWCKDKPGLKWWQADFKTYTDNEANTIFDINNRDRLEPPGNDRFANAKTFKIGNAIQDSNYLASSETGEPLPNGVPAATVWYQYTAATSGTISLSLNAASAESGLNVYTGALGSLTEVGSGNTISFNAASGVTYYIRVYTTRNPGNFIVYTYQF